ncbi:MAG: GTPase ObgE [Synergistales bacterium]|nr:GTPase ObgE [Synergistales bacterium]MDY6404985.1 GTPase ObgE [Synergistales bacterium]MDY6410318.1 GTPase ObgE [Synergistales bacterium]MDY6413572.1 GTPase ObgE [Synergistales bacterium]MDY6421748.1 GTPase ObgE [Synergistales bacterium]
MKFVDIAEIFVRAGRGGNGALSFRREKFVPKGGPDGADGGKGGDVIIEAVGGVVTLADFEYDRRFQAGHAGHGSGAMRTGANGEDLKIFVPCGTLIKDADNDEILADLVEPGQNFIAAHGGRGGKGNAHFANSARRAPKFAEKGDPGEERNLILELKLIADVGLAGFPNAGKSSILAAISGAKPKIAGYPFTTLSPNLGVLAVDDAKVVIADLPGLIEGAHEGKGLGLQFLRHVERTRILLHVIDLSQENPVETFHALINEFKEYGANLASRPCIVIGNKIDIEGTEKNSELLRAEAEKNSMPYMAVSALTGENIPELIKNVADLVRKTPPVKLDYDVNELIELTPKKVSRRASREPVRIIKQSDGSFRVEHENFEKAVSRINFEHEDALQKFSRLLKSLSVEEALEAAGAQEGDKVYIGDIEFDFEPETVVR